MLKKKLFKSKYAIAIYDDEEYLTDIFDNVCEIREKYSQKLVYKILNSIQKDIVFYNNGKKYQVFLINLVDEEQERDTAWTL